MAYTVARVIHWCSSHRAAVGLRAGASRVRPAGRGLLLPLFRTFALDPVAGARVALEVTVAVLVARLQMQQQRVPEPGVHAEAVFGAVAAHALA